MSSVLSVEAKRWCGCCWSTDHTLSSKTLGNILPFTGTKLTSCCGLPFRRRRRIWGQPLSEHFFQYIPPGEREGEGDKTKVHFTHWSHFGSISKNLLNQGNILVDHFMSTLLGNLFYLLWRSYILCDKYLLKFKLSCLEYNKIL